MEKKAPRVVRKVKIDGKRVFAAVAMRNGKLDFTRVVHKGRELVVKSGAFFLDYREGAGRKRRSVGTDPAAVKRALNSQAHVLELRSRGIMADDAPEIRRREHEGKSLEQIAADFRKHSPAGLRTRSVTKYRQAIDAFTKWAASVRVTHLVQVDAQVLGRWSSHMLKIEKLDASTVVDKLRIVNGEMKRRGVKIEMHKQDVPRVTEREVTVYRPEVLEQLFAACLQHELELYQFFLLTGFRDQEVAYFGWDDMDERRSTVSVHGKPELGFEPKNYQERTIRVPAWLMEMLKERKARIGTTCALVFGTSFRGHGNRVIGGKADINMLEKLKNIAFRAGLNCGSCQAKWKGEVVSCADRPVCQKFGLHKFRHTFATMLLRDKVDLVSVQKVLGHKDLESTRRYLRALEAEEMGDIIEGSTLSKLFAGSEAAPPKQKKTSQRSSPRRG